MTGEWTNRQRHNSERLRDVLKRGEEGFKRALKASGISKDPSALNLRSSSSAEVETPTGSSEVPRSTCQGGAPDITSMIPLMPGLTHSFIEKRSWDTGSSKEKTISGTKGSNMSLESSDLGRGGGDNQIANLLSLIRRRKKEAAEKEARKTVLKRKKDILGTLRRNSTREVRQRVNKLKDGTAEEVERLMYLKMELEKINQDLQKETDHWNDCLDMFNTRVNEKLLDIRTYNEELSAISTQCTEQGTVATAFISEQLSRKMQECEEEIAAIQSKPPQALQSIFGQSLPVSVQ